MESEIDKTTYSKTKEVFENSGRSGMIIDGTGHRYDKTAKLKKHAESLGYDCYMVFVNTSLKVHKKETNKGIEFYLMIYYQSLGKMFKII